MRREPSRLGGSQERWLNGFKVIQGRFVSGRVVSGAGSSDVGAQSYGGETCPRTAVPEPRTVGGGKRRLQRQTMSSLLGALGKRAFDSVAWGEGACAPRPSDGTSHLPLPGGVAGC